jgi:NAD(P)H-nitrite reductase large subunit
LHYVIIGNGGAGVSALQTIRANDEKSELTIISKEQYPAYSPCSLPDLIGGEIERPTIFRFEKNFYKNLNAKFIKNAEALRISIPNKQIHLSSEKKIKFDKLLISAGAKPIAPKQIKGINLKGVHIMGTLDSALGILDHVNSDAKEVVIVGGGFMGIETAIMLKKQGLMVTIVEMLPNILSRMLDSDISKKVEKILIENNIKLVLNDTVISINGDKKVTGVTLSNTKIKCDMVVIAIGVRPNIEITKGSGIKTNLGIIVDSTMQTNKNDIFAAGDIAEVKEQIEGTQGSFAIWPNAIEQGRIAGLNMVGKQTKYDGAEIVNILDIFDIPVVAMGRTSSEIGKCKVIFRFTPQHFKKILLKNNKIVGLQFIGTIRNAGTFYSLMKKGTDVSDIKDRLLDDNLIIAPEAIIF